MKHSANPPVYSQVAYDIAAKIAAGDLQEGQRFTGRSLMGSRYGVSAETIRRATGLLADMGIIEIQKNVGSVVRSRHRAVDYVNQYKAGKDLGALKNRLAQLIDQRDQLNREITEVTGRIVDLSERFRSSDQLRTYEFQLRQHSSAVGRSIGQLEFRQKTGATIVAVRRGEDVLLSPGPQMVLQAEDTLVIACDINSIDPVSRLLQQGGKN